MRSPQAHGIRYIVQLASVVLAACSTSAGPGTGGALAMSDAAGITDAEADAESEASGVVRSVRVSNFAYSPQKLTIRVGDTVQWDFVEGTHTVTEGTNCQAVAGGLNSGKHAAPFTFRHTFDAAGTINYFCDYREHCTMMRQIGTVEIVP